MTGMENEMPPMDVPSEIPEGPEMTGAEDVNQLPSDFDSNFDAGVEADEETDPKKYIQQLTGKLSQSLNSYNNENGEPDTELGKYVLGMLVKQGVKGMDDSDKKEIIKKINTTSDDEKTPENDMMSDEPIDNEIGGEEQPSMEEMPTESKTFNFTKQQIFENFGLAIDDNKDNTDTEKELDTRITPDTQRGRRTKPFEAPKKFKE